MIQISIVVLTKNAAEKLPECLESVRHLVEGIGEIILLDGGSTDKTLEIGKKYKARVIRQKPGSFDTWRNQGKEVAKGEWLFYIDPDERVSPELREEIMEMIARGPTPGGRRVLPRVLPPAYAKASAGRPASTSVLVPRSSKSEVGSGPLPAQAGLPPVSPADSSIVAYAIPRRNFVFGKELHHGGWWPDYVIRLMRKDALIKWEGELHEQPKINGEIGYLKNPFIHLKEDNLSDMVKKTNNWSEIEARLLLESGHPKMTWWRFFRPVIGEIFDRLVLKLGFLDGVPGVVFSIYQGWSRFITYAKLWEMQRRL